MRNEAFVICMLLFVSVLFIGCTQSNPPAGNPQNPPANPPANNTPTPPSNPPTNPVQPGLPTQTTSMDQIYKFGSLNSYEYRITSSTEGQQTTLNVKTSISSDTVNGTAAWLQQTDMSTQGVTVTSKTWVDKVTYGCLKTTTVMVYGGQTTEQAGQCPTEGPNSASSGETTAPSLTYVGKDPVTVPAGTYVADKYTGEGATYWSATGVPVPVKIAYNDGSATMELVSYT